MHHTLSAPQAQDLQCLLARLNEEVFPKTNSLCDQIDGDRNGLQLQGTPNAAKIYAGLCGTLTEHTRKYMRLRRLVLMPYFDELQQKEDEGHDCRSCSGRCTVQHATHIASIREAHAKMKELLLSIRQTGWSLHGAWEYPANFHKLRCNILLLDNTLEELLFIEESSLIPMMLDLQKKIGAYG